MRRYVWMAGWQMECCGQPFRTGAEVSWRLRTPNPAEVGWIDTVLPGGVALTIDDVEDHHGESSSAPTAATVVSIAMLHCLFAPEPVVDSGLITPVAEAQKWNNDLGGRRFAGFLVRILTTNSVEP